MHHSLQVTPSKIIQEIKVDSKRSSKDRDNTREMSLNNRQTDSNVSKILTPVIVITINKKKSTTSQQ